MSAKNPTVERITKFARRLPIRRLDGKEHTLPGLNLPQDHARLLQRLSASLRNGGVLALQVPYFLKQQPAAEVHLRLINSEKWRRYPPPDERLTVEDPAFYYDALAACCREAEVWETVYYHSLENHGAMVAW